MAREEIASQTLALFDLPDLHAAIPALILVIGEHDRPGDLVAEPRVTLELALFDSGFHRRAPQFVGEHVLAIEPVLHVRAPDDDARRVPLPARANWLVG